MGIRVLKSGMLTTVQDIGRTGYQSQGFSVAGVMDVRSFKIANLLLDNPENEAVLEFTLIGPTLEFTSETIIARCIRLFICIKEIFSHLEVPVREAVDI